MDLANELSGDVMLAALRAEPLSTSSFPVADRQPIQSGQRSTLDPDDWSATRRQAHQMLDDILDHMASLRGQPLWKNPDNSPWPGHEPLPRASMPLEAVHQAFLTQILPYSAGNAHPGFMGWVQGGGSPVGMLAEMLAAGLNANVGGRNHMAVRIEEEVGAWTRELFAFPASASGLFLTGASAANHVGVLIARHRAIGPNVRCEGMQGARLTAYASQATHGCVSRAMEMAGLGSEALRLVPVGPDHRINVGTLRFLMNRDRERGFSPFLIVGNAGTVDIGATDDLDALADIALDQDVHFHVDGAFGALAKLSPETAGRLNGVERADSLALDWHKWGQAPYDAGFVLVRDAGLLRQTFGSEAAYLQRSPRGLAAGAWWPCDDGPDLSRSFKALKVWFMLRTYGADALGGVVSKSCALARGLGEQIDATEELERLAPVPMNIVVFSWRGKDADRVNAEIVMSLHEEGRVAPSLTTIGGRRAIRAAFVNHRSDERDAAALLEGVLRLGRALTQHVKAA